MRNITEGRTTFAELLPWPGYLYTIYKLILSHNTLFSPDEK